MADHDPRDVEWMARFLCVSAGIDPDAVDYKGKRQWEEFKEDAIRALDYLAANGLKVTDVEWGLKIAGMGYDTSWANRHNVAPITPRDRGG